MQGPPVPQARHLSELAQALPLSPDELLRQFVPPPRFGRSSFEGYAPQNPSQERARDEVREFALVHPQRPMNAFRWPWQRPTVPHVDQGLYLDGGFGVGKTHLLAAAYHEAEGPKAYLSFQELVYLIGVLGMAKAKEALLRYQLLCVDEFELDDPGNTLIVKQLLGHVFTEGGRVLTTSNTLPEAQGQGRFNAEDFKREIQSVAKRFRALSLEGQDYRQRERRAGLLSEAALIEALEHEPVPGKVHSSWDELHTHLSTLHPVRYRELLEGAGTLYVQGVSPLEDQNRALRFVHFIDKLYDLNKGFRASGGIALEAIFHPSYRQGAFAKKYYRCVSRLAELLGEVQESA